MAVKAKVRGGAKLRAYLQQLERNSETARMARVGFLEGSTYTDGTPVAEIASIQEFGSLRKTKDGRQWIPPRQFFRTAIAEHKQEWADALAASMKRTGMDSATSLGRVAMLMVSDIQKSIIDWSDPPNAPSTIRKKKYNNPLIDTRTMYRAVDGEVK